MVFEAALPADFEAALDFFRPARNTFKRSLWDLQAFVSDMRPAH